MRLAQNVSAIVHTLHVITLQRNIRLATFHPPQIAHSSGVNNSILNKMWNMVPFAYPVTNSKIIGDNKKSLHSHVLAGELVN